MNIHTSYHLSGGEKVAASDVDSALLFDLGGHTLSIFVGRRLAPADRIRFLRELSDAASDLADEINLRDLEAAS